MVRPGFFAVTAIAVIASALSSGAAFAEPQSIKLEAAVDRHPVYISYYSPPAEKTPSGKQECPVVVLLHGAGGSRLQWDKGTTLPNDLVDKGIAVITVDLRKHGESIAEGAKKEETPAPSDYAKMVQGDLVAVKQFIYEEHQKQQLNMNKMAIVGADMSAPLALAFAELDWKAIPYDDAPIAANRTPRGQDVRAIVLISPDTNAGTVRSSASMNFLKNPRVKVAVQIVVGDEDTSGKKEAETLSKVFGNVRGNEELLQYQPIPRFKDHGMPLVMKDRNLAPFIAKFLEKHLPSLGSSWTDRRSRLER